MFEALALALALAQSSPQPIPTPQVLRVTVLRAPRATLRVQVAQTEPQRERGLMGVRRLAPHTGMLFVFDSDAPTEFWMKDTLIPLDMVFISGNGIVRQVFANVPVVSTDTSNDRIPRRDGVAKFVLELPAGEALLDGFKAGGLVPGLAPNR
ncbi:MAG TPA: DUF192 domain-containing protein [Candidatus Rubrimentiphilum sp.]|nr:DUF192 domain-containing protein [Candidatus Rubrimentiphilum sp.]